MRKIFLFFILLSFNTYAQKVPSKLDFAGMKLHLSKRLQNELQEEVDKLTRSPKYFKIKVDRARIYFPLIEQIFAEEDVPDDMKYLVLQESALIPDAVSVSNAVGYWQFKDFTAMEVGLRVDRKVDERMHIVSSTYGAARYLKQNNTFFDNWLYALQAYQMGAGGAMKVVDDKYYGAKSMELDHKTYWYVKKYLAHKIAFESVVGEAGPLQLDIYNSGANKSLKEVATETSISYDDLVAYNVWLRSGRIPDDKIYPVILPVSAKEAEKIKLDLENSQPSNVPKRVIVMEENRFPEFGTRKLWFRDETVKTINNIPGFVAGDEATLIDLASRAGISLSRFMKYNDLGVKDQPIKGQVYYTKRKRAKGPTYYHVVKYDETLWEISQRYGVRLNKLMLKNRLSSEEDIKPGLVLWLRHVRPATVPAEYKELPDKEEKEAVQKKVYAKKVNTIEAYEKKESVTSIDTVQSKLAGDSLMITTESDRKGAQDSLSGSINDESGQDYIDDENEAGDNQEEVVDENMTTIIHTISAGETYYSLSKTYQVDVVDILNWNELHISDKLSIGQKLKIVQPKSNNEQEESVDLQDNEPAHHYHDVTAGETLYQIARKYSVTIQQIMNWNNMDDNTISIGDRLIIRE